MTSPTIDDIQVVVKFLNRGNLLAQCSVIFFDAIETHGWRIMISTKGPHQKFQESIWIQPPSYRAGRRYKNTVFISNTKLYEQIEEKIYDEYRAAKLTSNEASQSEAEKIADEVPF